MKCEIVSVIAAASLGILLIIFPALNRPVDVVLEDSQIREVYSKLIAQTGQTQSKLPLIIEDDAQVNAYNDGTKIVLFTGMIKALKNYDEVALVLGHEIAHGTLGHLGGLAASLSNDQAVLEGNADKMGAVYALKAGYDVCMGRKFWKRERIEEGNYQGLNHPDYSYRYDELNFNCENL
jgi:predicted Zn-dependent protease